MKKILKASAPACRLAVVAGCVVAAAIASRPTTAAAATVQKPGFSLAVPAGWREMPPEVLQTFYENAKRQSVGGKVVRYDYGFQLDAADHWLDYPYVLVRVDTSGRISEPDLKTMPRIDLHGPGAQMRYDEDAHLVWMTLDADVPGIGKIRGLAGMIPTDQGWVHVNGYARAEDFERFAHTFGGIARSIRIAPEWAYRPHVSDNAGPFRFIDSGNFWVQFTAASVLLGFLALGVWRNMARPAIGSERVFRTTVGPHDDRLRR